MQPWVIAVIVGVIVVATAIAWFIYDQRRSTRLKQHFGPEYNRAVLGTGNRRRAEAELAQREALAKELRERPLHSSEREKFMSEWKMCQAQFVDDPSGAVERADQLLVAIMQTRGYSIDNPYERMMDIAAAYPHHASKYREAGEILSRHRRSEASTEELRTAFLHYRTLFDDLLGGYDEELRKAS
jgi:hypothetical protein